MATREAESVSIDRVLWEPSVGSLGSNYLMVSTFLQELEESNNSYSIYEVRPVEVRGKKAHPSRKTHPQLQSLVSVYFTPLFYALNITCNQCYSYRIPVRTNMYPNEFIANRRLLIIS